MSDCPNCHSTILNRTPTLISNSRCNTNPCPEDTTCGDGIFASGCIFYSGPNLPCTGMLYGETVTSAMAKIDAKVGTKVSSGDTCCGYLFDKVVSDTITKSIVIEGGCQKLKLEVTDNPCDGLDWIDLDLESPFVNGGSISQPGDLAFDFGEGQEVQYALDSCNGKVEFRGIISIPSGTVLTSPFDLVATLPVGYRPAKTRMVPLGIFPVSSDGTLWAGIVILSNGQIYISSSALNDVIEFLPAWISLDGFSIEIPA